MKVHTVQYMILLSVLSRVGDREDTGLLCWAVMVERWPHQQLTGQRRIRE
jgi:hypothetical protein